MESLRVVFMGSPEFAVPSLQHLAANMNVVGVITQPDRPAGRGKTLTPPPVKLLAEQLGLPIFQPERLRRPEAFQVLEEWNPDLIVVTAFGQILRQNVLDLPRFGCINVHASLLPRWRGAAPIQAAILNGDIETGVTIMKMDAGVDTGAMLAQQSMVIQPDDTSQSLGSRLAEMGAILLLNTMPDYIAGKLKPVPQDDQQATYAPMLKKEDGILDFNLTAVELARRVNAFNPWPGCFMVFDDVPLKILRSHAVSDSRHPVGRRMIVNGLPAVGTQAGVLVLDEVQPAGKKPMPGKVFLNGARTWVEILKTP